MFYEVREAKIQTQVEMLDLGVVKESFDLSALDPRPRLDDLLVDLLERGDPDALVERLAPGAVLWHNSDHRDMDAVAGVQAITGLHALVDDLRVDVVARAELPDGFVLRYVLRGEVKAAATPFAAHQCVVVRVVDGLITRIDEYVDPTMLAQLGVEQ